MALAQHRLQARWARLQVGMSQDEVRSLLDTPSNIYDASLPQSCSLVGDLLVGQVFDTHWEKWAYGRRRLLAFQSTFPFIGLRLDGLLLPEPDDYVVSFTADGNEGLGALRALPTRTRWAPWCG